LLDSFRPARYNLAVLKEDGEAILYNSLTGARLNLAPGTVTGEQLAALEQVEWPPEVPRLAPALAAALAEYRLLVPPDTDELGLFESVRRSHAEDPSFRRVNVVLTRRCNLGCGYCFQDKQLGDAKADPGRLLSYLCSQAVPGGRLEVNWFGGEPTLRLDTIFSLSDALLPICRERNTEYSASITTNGVLLNEERIDALMQRAVRGYQISLDGPAPVQERRRPSLRGLPTYESILKNVGLLIERGATVVIKVIVDRENYEAVPQLFADLAARGLLPHLQVAVQHTEAKFAAAAYDKRFPSLEAFTRVKLDLLRVLEEYGYPLRQPSLHPEFCAATSRYSTQIDMAGNFYRCGEEPVNLTGHLDPDATSQVFTNLAYERMFTERRFAHAMCETCKVLPICGGGCTVAAEGLAEREICSFYKVGIKDYLRLVDAHERRARPPEEVAGDAAHRG
jgi:uncharacterized protein